MSRPAPTPPAELASLRHDAQAFGERLAVLQQAGLLGSDAGQGDPAFAATGRMHRQVWEYAYVLADTGEPAAMPERPEPAHLEMLVDGVAVTRVGLLPHAPRVNPPEPAGHPSWTSP